MRNGHDTRSDFPLAPVAAAVGLVTGLALGASRKLAAHVAQTLTGEWSDTLKAEHLMVVEAFDAIEATAPENERRRVRLLTRLKSAIEKHAWQEENVIYPAVRLAGAGEAASSLIDDHAEVKALLFELDGADPGADGWRDLVRRLRTLLEAHMRKEENEIFPALQAALSPEQSVELTAAIHRAAARLD